MPSSLGHVVIPGRLKGAALAAFLSWYEDEHGADALAARIAPLPATLLLELGLDRRESLQILASRWYDCRAIGVLLDAIVADASAAEFERLANAAAQAVMGSTLRGVYQLLFSWLATPERYARHCNRLWTSYHDTGTMRIEHTRGEAVCSISNWSGHHPLLCAMCRASAEVIYREMGCERVQTLRECCVADGGQACRFVTRWRAAT